MLEYSGFGGRLVRRSVITTCISLLIASALLCALTTGCGGNLAAENYLTEANKIINDVNTKAGDLKKYRTIPLADQGGLSKTVAGFRKLLGTAQDKLDSAHPPQQCLGLDEKLRQVLEKARELTDLYSPFADYFDGVAPLAGQMTEAVSSLQAFQKGQDSSSTLLGLTEKAKAIDIQSRSITPPAVFTGMHQEFERFMESMVADFQKASDEYGASQQSYDYSQTPSYDQSQSDQTTTSSDQQGSSQNTTTQPALEQAAKEWASFNAELSTQIGVVQDVVGVAARNTEFEALVGQAVEEIKGLEKQFK